jgi:hypothetical protein
MKNRRLFVAAKSSILGALFAISCGLLLLLSSTIANAAERQVLQGHVPAAVIKLHLQPVGRLAETNHLNLAIGLPLRNRESLTTLLQQIYDPASPNYHHYLTPKQFTEMFGPTEQDYQALIGFAKANGLSVTATHPNRALLDVNGSVANIETALHVTMRTYRHPTEARTFYAPDVEPSLDLAVPVLHISGLDNYVLPCPMNLKMAPVNRTGATPNAGSGPFGAYMGNDFRSAYVPSLPLNGSGQTVGLFELDGYYTNDIAAYKSQAGLPNVVLKNVLLDGFSGSPGGANVEVALDIDMAISMAPGLSSVIVYEGEIPDDVLNRMATDNLAKQLSSSWGWSGDSNATLDQIFQQFAAQGQSYFNASGDSDAYPAGSFIFQPAEDSFITVVGGTTLTTTVPGGPWASETVWNWDVEYYPYDDGVGGSGGISTNYLIPIWQQGINMTTNQGSTAMRNIPDVALTADNVFVIADNGELYLVGGTSCATPLWAGFIALVNQQATADGKPTVGFINPAIYAIGKGASYTTCFHDITTGNNTWSQSSNRFYAVPGYDLCTGWGTPSGSNLVNALVPPDALQISPQTGFTSSGGMGGPFAVSSQDYVLTNGGSTTLTWAAASTASWLNVSPTGGTLGPGGSSMTVTVSLSSASTSLSLGTYGASVWFTNLSDGVVQSRPFTLSIIEPPVITTEPTNQSVLGGATATFAVTAAGGLPLLCQWRFNGVNLTDGGNISGSSTNLTDAGNIYGSATSVLTVSNVTSANVGTYSMIVSNAAGVMSSTSAGLAIIPSAPVITQQPASQTVFAGTTAQFAVAAVGNAPLFYQWQENGTNLIDGGNISGSASTTLTLRSVLGANIGTYSVVVSNAIASTTSTGAVLTVDVIQAGGQLIQNGGFETGTFSSWAESGNFADCSVGASALCVHSGNYGALLGPAGSLGYLSQTLPTLSGQTYLLSLWLNSPDGLGPNEFLVAWNGNVVFDQTNLGAIGWTNLQFHVTATGPNTVVQFGCRDDQSFLGLDDITASPLLSADGAPVIVAEPASQTVATVGDTVTFSVLAFGKLPLSYQWESDTTNIVNATNASLTLTNLTASQAGTYDVVVSNALGSATSSNAVLSVLIGTEALITFDDLTSGNVPVPNGYGSLSWSNFYYLDGVVYGDTSGYGAGVISSNNVAYNAFGSPASISNATPFDLLSAYLTAAWNDNLRVEVKGYAGATVMYDNTYTLSATVPALINLNYLGVTTIEFISSGGTPHLGYDGSGTEFVMDNMKVVFPPGPPPTPSNLVATAVGVSQINLAWSGSSVATGYIVNRGGSPIAVAATNTYSDTGLTPSTTYCYTVAATNIAGASSNSTSACATTFSATTATNLLAHWTFDEGSGTIAYDYSGNSNTGTVVLGSGGWTSGIINGALSFDGESTEVSVPNSSSLNPVNGITLAAWVNAGGWFNNARILEKGASDNQYALFINSSGSLEFLVAGITNGTLITSPPSAGAWHHLAAAYDGSSVISLYIDGQLATQQPATGSMPVTADSLAIGDKPSGSPANYFYGAIDDVRIYGSALPRAQIAQLYDTDSVGDGIPNWWRAQYFANSSATDATSCAACDMDGTGQNNLFKYVAGLDPIDPTQVFTLQIAPLHGQPNEKSLTFSPVATGRTYIPQWNTGVVNGTYNDLTGFSGPQTNGTHVTVTDQTAVQTNKFYRIHISLP